MGTSIRSEFIVRLQGMPVEYAEIAIKAFDYLEREYTISPKSQELITYSVTAPREFYLYYETQLVEGKSGQGTKNRYYLLKDFFAYVRKPLEEITANDVRSFMYAYKSQKNIADSTLDRYRSYLSAFFTWCVAERVLQGSPMTNIKPIRFEAPQREALSQVELEYVRRACETKLEKCIVEMFYSTGCRLSELANMKLSEVDLNDNTALVHGKGKKTRIVFINAKAKVALQEYLATRTDDCEYVLIASRKRGGEYVALSGRAIQLIVSKIMARTSITKHITPHNFRHTTATVALANNMPIDVVRSMLGHSSCNTTLQYTHTTIDRVRNEHTRCVV